LINNIIIWENIMKLIELNSKPGEAAKQALREQFNFNLSVDKLGLYDTRHMLSRVRTLINETKTSNARYDSEQNPAYLKLIFLEQALVSHYSDLKSLPTHNARIVVENEEVQKSQVVLAAQEMVDTIQKMVEQVSDMLVKELPAVKSGVDSEFGTSEGEQFNSAVSEALSSLQAALTQSKVGVEGALSSMTGQGGFDGMDAAGDTGMEEPAPDMGADLGAEEMTPEPTGLDSEEPMEPEEEPVSNVGRAVR